MPRQPSLFVSHGSPMMSVEDSPARRFLCEFSASLERPEAILIASAHWETPFPAVGAAARLETIYDFYGFPQPLYEMSYPAPGTPEVGARAGALLAAHGIDAVADHERGLDHGAWVPLRLMFADADIPVAQVATQGHLGPRHHYEIGRALEPLRDEGVMVIGSGNLTHNLHELRRDDPEGSATEEVVAFADWVFDAVARGRIEDLIDYRALAPHAQYNHPSEEHFLPLFTALGAGGDNGQAARIHASTSYGALSMDMYRFD